MDFLLLIYPISLLAIYFYKCEIAKGNDFNEECFSREQTKMLQALACIFVVLHHLTQVITSYGDLDRGPITLLSQMGILFTSIFIFFSGYGLITSVKSKPSYLDNFIRHRLSTILVPFFVANIIAVLLRIFYMKISMSQLIATNYAIKRGVNINTPSKINSWDYKDYRTSWWWLKGNKGITAPIVSAEGTIETDEKYVNKPNGAIRPAIWIIIE